jgi:hypothetical protein
LVLNLILLQDRPGTTSSSDCPGKAEAEVEVKRPGTALQGHGRFATASRRPSDRQRSTPGMLQRHRSSPKNAPMAPLVSPAIHHHQTQKPFPSWRGSGVEILPFPLSKNSATPMDNARALTGKPTLRPRFLNRRLSTFAHQSFKSGANFGSCDLTGKPCHTHRHHSLQATAQEDPAWPPALQRLGKIAGRRRPRSGADTLFEPKRPIHLKTQH